MISKLYKCKSFPSRQSCYQILESNLLYSTSFHESKWFGTVSKMHSKRQQGNSKFLLAYFSTQVSIRSLSKVNTINYFHTICKHVHFSTKSHEQGINKTAMPESQTRYQEEIKHEQVTCKQETNEQDKHVSSKPEQQIHTQQKISQSNQESSSIYRRDHVELEYVTEEEYNQYLKLCTDQLRTRNREQYLLTKYLPNDSLKTLAILLHNLNSELSQIKSSVSKNELGADIRLQWWHDAIKDTINGIPPRVPVLIVLSAYIKKSQRNGMQVPWWTLLRKMINSKKMDLSWASQPPTLEAIERYGDSSYGSILTLMLATLGIRDQYAENVAAHVGCAFGLSILLRGTIYHAKNQLTYLPADLCAKHGVSEHDIYTAKKREDISKVVFDVAESSFAHLKQAREKQEKMNVTPEVMRQITSIFYPSILCEIILRRLEKNDFDIFSTSLEPDHLLFEFSTKLFWKQYFSNRKI